MAFLFQFCQIGAGDHHNNPNQNTEPLLNESPTKANKNCNNIKKEDDELIKLQKQNESLYEEMNELKKQILRQNQEEINAFNLEKREMEKSFIKLDQEYKITKNELDKIRIKYDEINGEKDEWLAAASKDDDKSQQILQQLTKYKQSSQENDKQIVELQRCINDKQQKYDDLHIEYKQLQQEIDKTKNENDSLKEKLSENGDEIQVLEQQINQYQIWLEKSTKIKQELQENIIVINNKLKQQNQDIDKKNSLYEILYKEHQNAQKKNEEILREYQNLHKIKNELQEQYENTKIEIGQLTLKNKELQNKLESNNNNNNNNINNDHEIKINEEIKKKFSVKIDSHIPTISSFKGNNSPSPSDLIYDKNNYSNYDLQIEILNNIQLKEESLKLLTVNNNGLIKFMTKMVKSNHIDKIWNKLDPNNTGKIKTKKILKCLTLPVIFYKITQYQQKQKNNKDGSKPNVDNAEIKKSIEHLCIWIITTYGKKGYDNGYRIELTKQDFKTKLVPYLQAYVDCKGKHKL